MTSEVDVANRACAAAGTRSTIANLTEASKEAKACSLLLSGVRDAALEMAPWDFARAAVTLGLLKQAPGTPGAAAATSTLWATTGPMPPWLYEYTYPSDCIRVRWVIPQSEGFTSLPPARWVRSSDLGSGGGRVPVILTNAPLAVAIYTVQLTDPNTWTPLFTEAVVLALAAKLSIPLSGDEAIAQANLKVANDLILQARVTDGNESFAQIDSLPDWLRARDSLPYPYEPPDPLTFVSLFQLS